MLPFVLFFFLLLSHPILIFLACLLAVGPLAQQIFLYLEKRESILSILSSRVLESQVLLPLAQNRQMTPRGSRVLHVESVRYVNLANVLHSFFPHLSVSSGIENDLECL